MKAVPGEWLGSRLPLSDKAAHPRAVDLRYEPHAITVTPSALQVMSDPVPLPDEGVLSPELQDFILQCMRKDPFARPSAEALLSHDFILKVATRPRLHTAQHGCHPHMVLPHTPFSPAAECMLSKSSSVCESKPCSLEISKAYTEEVSHTCSIREGESTSRPSCAAWQTRMQCEFTAHCVILASQVAGVTCLPYSVECL